MLLPLRLNDGAGSGSVINTFFNRVQSQWACLIFWSIRSWHARLCYAEKKGESLCYSSTLWRKSECKQSLQQKHLRWRIEVSTSETVWCHSQVRPIFLSFMRLQFAHYGPSVTYLCVIVLLSCHTDTYSAARLASCRGHMPQTVSCLFTFSAHWITVGSSWPLKSCRWELCKSEWTK